MIELFIIGFACISVVAFVSTKDDDKNKQEFVIEKIDETPT